MCMWVGTLLNQAGYLSVSLLTRLQGAWPKSLIFSTVMLTTNSIWCLRRNCAILPFHLHAFMMCRGTTSLLLYTNLSSLVESLDALESLEARLSRLSGLCGRSSRSLRSKSLSLLSLRSTSRSRSLSQSRSLRSVFSRSSCGGSGGGGGGGGARGCFHSLSRHSPLSCRPKSREDSYSSNGSCLKVATHLSHSLWYQSHKMQFYTPTFCTSINLVHSLELAGSDDKNKTDLKKCAMAWNGVTVSGSGQRVNNVSLWTQ